MTLRATWTTIGSVALVAAPAVASAATEVHVAAVPGVGNVVVATDDDTAGVIETTLGIDPDTAVHDVAVKNLAGVTAGGAPCGADASSTVVACEGDFVAIVVFGQGGN